MEHPNPEDASGPRVPPTQLRKPCCTSAPKVESNYVPKGQDVTVDDIIVYETPRTPSRRVVICAYDIFGFHRNTKEVCDRLAEKGGFQVVLPDFYRGDYWRDDRPIQLIYSWVNYHGCWEDTAKDDVIRIINHYKTEGAASFGMFGFCWGGKISVLAGIEIPDIRAIGLVHPSGVKIYEANKLNIPVALLPSSQEIDFIPFWNKMVDRFGESYCIHHRFDNMLHGFSAARGDFTNPAIREAVTEVIEHLSEFFQAHLSSAPQGDAPLGRTSSRLVKISGPPQRNVPMHPIQQ